ncbi:hypothetical protein [Sulfurimonas sp.]|uniref:hypothetical protein n=1 Tax=Sulfurimonas sp. TaxID=2022749 RepID=UPI00262D4602|nr:hypothetical protein [Sulfurimonas sp.]
MDVILLLKSIAGLVAVLVVLTFFLVYNPKKKQNKQVKKKNILKENRAQEKHDMQTLLAIIRDKKSTTKELEKAVDLLLKYHGKIPKKLGLRPHPEFDVYAEIILRICRHPNTNKDIIVKLDRELEKLNKEYMKEIDDTLTKGLNSRGV